MYSLVNHVGMRETIREHLVGVHMEGTRWTTGVGHGFGSQQFEKDEARGRGEYGLGVTDSWQQLGRQERNYRG